jgi:hypothetical protein
MSSTVESKPLGLLPLPKKPVELFRIFRPMLAAAPLA